MNKILIILIIIIILISLYYYFSFESFDNYIPNKIRWAILNSSNKEEFRKNYKNCLNACQGPKPVTFPEFRNHNYGCYLACNELVRDRVGYLELNKYNQFNYEPILANNKCS